MAIYDIRDYMEQREDKIPRRIAFHTAVYPDLDGNDKAVNVSVTAKNGDVDEAFQTVIENGRIAAEQEDGSVVFIPWPCAAVETKDL